MRLLKYSAVSFGSILLTQLLLLTFVVVGLTPTSANAAAVLVAAVPAFLVNRYWTWRDRDDARIGRQLTIFWVTVLAGLGLSTAAVWATAKATDSAPALVAANLASFALLWAVRYLVLDRVAFVERHPAEVVRPERRTIGRTIAAIPFVVMASIATVVHAWGMDAYPARFDDEGTYVSQAWSVMANGELSHYTYWYDHPPLGWIQLVPWMWMTGGLDRAASAIAAGREVMLLVHVISLALIYVWARRSGMRRGFALLAVGLFSLSPLGIFWQRQVLLDNLGVMWLLAAFALVRSPSQRLTAHAGAGACFAMAVLSKETLLLLLPALIWELWRTAPLQTRRYSMAIAGSVLSSLVVAYPLMALLRGELFPGEEHVSLWDGIAFQLFERSGSGFILDPSSDSYNTLTAWLAVDPWLLSVALVALPVAFLRAGARGGAVALLISLVTLLRPGYLPIPYIIVLIPLCAFVIASAGQEVWDRVAAFVRNRPGRPILAPSLAGAVLALVAVMATQPAQAWARTVDRQLGADADSPYRAAHAWLDDHAARDARLIVDNTIWLDLVMDGYDRQKVVWFYKLDLDPQVAAQYPRKWREFDLVVSTSLMRTLADDIPTVQGALANSTVVARFGRGLEQIEIRKIGKERR